MNCKNCGNIIENNSIYCGGCGKKIEYKNNKFFLKNYFMLILFILNIILIFIGQCISYTKELFSQSYGNGLMLIFIPVIAFVMSLVYVIPQIIGTILSTINIFIKKYVLLIFVFFSSLASLITTILTYNIKFNSGLIFWLTLIEVVILNIIILYKLINKINE